MSRNKGTGSAGGGVGEEVEGVRGAEEGLGG
jgi:hypothetical protein